MNTYNQKYKDSQLDADITENGDKIKKVEEGS